MSLHPICWSPHFYWNISILLEPTTSRCELFGVPPFQTVLYDDVFSGRILYESSFYGNLLMTLTSSSFSLSSTYRVSAECEFKIQQHFQSFTTDIRCRQHTDRLNAAASCTVEVLLKCHPAIHLFNGLQYNQAFIRALLGVTPRVRISLPPFSEFLERFDAAANAFYRQYNSHAGNYPLKLCEEHGLARKDDNPNNLPSVHPKGITAPQAASHVGSVVVDTMEHHIGDVSSNNSNFVDVRLGYTPMEQAITSNEEVTNVTIRKKDVPLAPHGNSFLLGIHGHFISPHFYRKTIEHVQKDLAFCKSPTGNRMLRVLSEVPSSIFLLRRPGILQESNWQQNAQSVVRGT